MSPSGGAGPADEVRAGGVGQRQAAGPEVRIVRERLPALESSRQVLQTRVDAAHQRHQFVQTLEDRLRLGVNMTVSRINNDYLPFENTGGFEGGVFTNMVIYDPTAPVMVTDPGTSPSKPGAQFAFGAGVAVVYGLFMVAHIAYGLFLATAVVCLIRGMFLWGLHFVDKAQAQRRAEEQKPPIAVVPDGAGSARSAAA